MKKIILIVVNSLVLSLLMFITPYMSRAEALTPNLDGYKKFSHTAWSANYGLKTFIYRSSYLAYKYTDSTYKYVKDHDYMAYKCDTDVIFPPIVGNGQVILIDVNMVDTNGRLYSPVNGSSFSNGSYYSRLICSGMTFIQKKCPTIQKASKSLSLKNRVETWFILDDIWFPSLWMDEYTWTQSY